MADTKLVGTNYTTPDLVAKVTGTAKYAEDYPVDDMPGAAAGATLGEGVQATAQAERGLTNEPLYQGEPILALAATSEAEAVDAIEAIDIEFEPLPFVVDPIESLRPGGANARTQG